MKDLGPQDPFFQPSPQTPATWLRQGDSRQDITNHVTLKGMQDNWIKFDAIVATTHRVEKYGGVRVPEQTLQDLATALNDGRLPLMADHDPRTSIRTRSMTAQVVDLPDGEHGVRLTGQVHPDDAEAFKTRRGMSFSMSETIERVEGIHPDAEPIILFGDAACFDDAAITEACSLMSTLAPAEGHRLYQFAHPDEARVILELSSQILYSLGPSIAASAIWDGLKLLMSSFLSKRLHTAAQAEPISIELMTPLPNGEVIGFIKTDDPEVAKAALATYESVVRIAANAETPTRSVSEWIATDSASGKWELSNPSKYRDRAD